MSRHSTNIKDNSDTRENLEQLLEKIKTKDVDQVILFGTSDAENLKKKHNLGLIVVQETDKTFIERLDEWYTFLKPGTAIDLLVYTPEEFDDLKSWNSFVKTALTEGKVLLDSA